MHHRIRGTLVFKYIYIYINIIRINLIQFMGKICAQPCSEANSTGEAPLHALLGERRFVDNDSVSRPRLKARVLQLVFCHLRVAENGLKLVADQEKTGEAQTVCFSWATAAITFCQVTGFQISNDRRKGYLVSGGCLRFLVAPSS